MGHLVTLLSKGATISAPTGPVVIVQDSFNRANNTTSLGNADTGQTYTYLFSTLGISNNQVYGTAGEAVALIDAFNANVTITLTISVVSTSTGIYFRYVDSANYWFYSKDNVSGGYKLYKRVANVSTVVMDTAQICVNGDVISVKCNGNSITCYINATSFTPIIDAFASTGTKHGFDTGEESVGRLDNFKVETLGG